ncbi:MAG: hypothetical protein KME13_18610 [Myxacorys californica WJT36-NPBG1]|jgi:hypothetical protein|nr:hypothetical protein [Myxacorys californica WJT36-NPBG1]
MLINDLSYLESISEPNTVSGGILVGVTADALATGDPTLALTDTTTTIRELGNGGFMGKGRGKAVAIGDDPLAFVNVFGDGDKVITHTKVKYFPNKDMMVAKGFIKVMDRP